jgi:hypothetical protein
MPALQTYQYRVLHFKDDIDTHLNRLRNFLSSPKFADTNIGEQQRLKEQADLMAKLSDVLARRIVSFTEGNPATIALSPPDQSVYRFIPPPTSGLPKVDVLSLESIGTIYAIQRETETAAERKCVGDVPDDAFVCWGMFSMEHEMVFELRPSMWRSSLIAAEPYLPNRTMSPTWHKRFMKIWCERVEEVPQKGTVS